MRSAEGLSAQRESRLLPSLTDIGGFAATRGCTPCAAYAAIKTIRGESTFSKELLSSLIVEAEAKCQELQENMEKAQAAYDEGKTVLASLNAQYDDIISWAEMYDTASMEAKKMIVNCLIKRVDVYWDYKLHIDFNIDFEQFCGGLDIVTIAA